MSAYEGLDISERKNVTRVVIWIAGGWFFGIFLTFLVTMNNSLHLTPKKLQGSEVIFSSIPASQRPIYLQYIGSALTRSLLFFASWLQLATSIIVLCLFLYSRKKALLVLSAVVLALIISCLFCFRVVPQFIRQGRLVDFLQYTNPKLPAVSSFKSLRTMMFFLGIIQMSLLLYTSVSLCLERPEGEGGN